VSPSGTQCDADRKFLSAAFRPNQQQVRDIGTSDQQDDANGAKQHP
jgi:hypothetical protein